MNIQIVEQKIENGNFWCELSSENKAVQIYVGGSFATVCVANASHRVWKGCGRVFHGQDKLGQAEASYKCGKVKAMISLAKVLFEESVQLAS